MKKMAGTETRRKAVSPYGFSNPYFGPFAIGIERLLVELQVFRRDLSGVETIYLRRSQRNAYERNDCATKDVSTSGRIFRYKRIE